MYIHGHGLWVNSYAFYYETYAYVWKNFDLSWVLFIFLSILIVEINYCNYWLTLFLVVPRNKYYKFDLFFCDRRFGWLNCLSILFLCFFFCFILGGSGIGGSAEGACLADDSECTEYDRLGMEAIRSLHQQLDDDENGNIDLSESDDVRILFFCTISFGLSDQKH